uniref:Uncharacterized protein n=1 Tax=Anopheles aquasalis TaxID=42839 RepID=T1E950_ANOAQ
MRAAGLVGCWVHECSGEEDKFTTKIVCVRGHSKWREWVTFFNFKLFLLSLNIVHICEIIQSVFFFLLALIPSQSYSRWEFEEKPRKNPFVLGHAVTIDSLFLFTLSSLLHSRRFNKVVE